ncbi:divergent polysaccharide deacetylase family protein [Pseudoalteromonas sp. SSM20]|uniref:divergent polysaccharide deacetylase family protein n=1 Tax=Pseudoalteromonas sp. SSM20 TaxID=3139394 RepID=UPI003BAACC6F
MYSVQCFAARVAILIDDIGNHANDLTALDISGQLSYAILPFTPYANSFSKRAATLSRDVILHVPMEAISGKALGPGALTSNMDKDALQKQLNAALDNYPQVIGVNNHMGSFLTQKVVPMAWTMEVLRDRSLFFIDSKTSKDSQAQNMAKLFGVANASRQVFLDNIPNEKQMMFRLRQLIHIAKKSGSGIAIAHPYPETIKFLPNAITALKEEGIELVPVSDLIVDKPIRLANQSNAD